MNERAAIIAYLRRQSDLGANRGNEAAKGTLSRAAFGGGSLALHRAANSIEQGEHLLNDNDNDNDSSDPKVQHLGVVLQFIADQHADVLTPRQIKALYVAAAALWDMPEQVD